MKTFTVHIKNMCCSRCVDEIKNLVMKSGVIPSKVILGEVYFRNKLSDKEFRVIESKINAKGFSIATSNIDNMIIRIKSMLIKYLSEILSRKSNNIKLSSYLEKAMNLSYSHISRTFSSKTGFTIENYFISLRIEKAKELIIQNELTSSEIAYELGYNSPQTFFTQFKKHINKTPGKYKLNPKPERIHLDRLLPQNFKQKRKNT